MNDNLFYTILLTFGFLALFGSAEILYNFFKVKTEYTRKLVHVGTGLITLLFPLLLTHHLWVLFLCSSFAVLLLLSLKFSFLPSINNIERKSVGSLAYPLAVYISFLAFDFMQHQSINPAISKNANLIYFYLPMLTLAISDPMAALLGRNLSKRQFSFFSNNKILSLLLSKNLTSNFTNSYQITTPCKTIIGSTAFFGSAFLIGIVLFFSLNELSFFVGIGLAFLIAFCATFSEAFSKKGWDNLTIPATVIIVLFLFSFLLPVTY
ncbi:hypothetical protein ACE193_05965 [Bernardetia sp. OM2101]|uniref:hypothetical protein n=1 Tax=Bernardetia sp. OM2101 TaxID=3344876 RepID=UPI0035D0D4A0